MNIYETAKSGEQQEYQSIVRELTEYVQNVVDFGTAELSTEERQKMDTDILAKLQAGKRLSAKELKYLKRYNPALYMQAVRVEAKRASVEERLKHAHSKQKVEEIQLDALSSVSKNDIAREYLTAAVLHTVTEFKKTVSYKKLPEVEEKGKKVQVNERDTKADREEEKSEKKKLAVTYEFSAGAYQMAYVSE